MKSNVYSSIKLFKYPEHVTSLAKNEILPPVHIRIKPTNACNHNCWFCAYKVSNLELGEDMNPLDKIPQEKMQEIVNDIIAMKVKAVTFSGGGEPLIYPHIVETATRLGENGVKIATLTNGSFLQGEVANVFAKYGSWVRISIDGWDDKSLQKFRGTGPNEFTKISENIENFAKIETDCVLGISFIVTQENHEHIYDFSKYMRELGVNHIKIAGCVVSVDGKENNAYHNKFNKKVYEEIERASELNSDSFTIVNHYHDMEERFDKEYKNCRFLQFLTVIGADCNVYTCQDKAYTKPGLLGSIKEQSFKEYWYSKQNLDKMLAIDPSIHCKHHCVSNCKNLLINEFLNINKDHIDFV